MPPHFISAWGIAYFPSQHSILLHWRLQQRKRAKVSFHDIVTQRIFEIRHFLHSAQMLTPHVTRTQLFIDFAAARIFHGLIFRRWYYWRLAIGQFSSGEHFTLNASLIDYLHGRSIFLIRRFGFATGRWWGRISMRRHWFHFHISLTYLTSAYQCFSSARFGRRSGQQSLFRLYAFSPARYA